MASWRMGCQFIHWCSQCWRLRLLLPGFLKLANPTSVVKFFATIALVVLSLIAVGLLLSYFGLWYWTNNVLWTLLVISSLTVLIHLLNVGAFKLSTQGSVIILLSAMVIKLLVGGTFVLYLIYIYPALIVSTVVSFFSFYVLFSVIQIYSIKKMLQL